MSQEKYQEWILKNVKHDGYGQCQIATKTMAKAFPELTRVRGHYFCPVWGERPHWWLVTQDGEIVDPTKNQHPSKGKGHYEPWDESQPEPTGICPNCGEYCYGGKSVCSDECFKLYKAYLDSCT